MRFIKSILNRFQRPFSNNKKSNVNSRGLKFEPLEDRSLLSAVPAAWSLASVSGTYSENNTPVVVLNLSSSTEGSVLIGIDYNAADGSSIKPGEISVYSYNSETKAETDITNTATYLNFDGDYDQENILYVKLSAGEYHIKMTPEESTLGNFNASVFLVGDTSGTGKVDTAAYDALNARVSAIALHNKGTYSQATLKLYQSRYGILLTQSAEQLYNSKYDFDLDGQLTAGDSAAVKINIKAAVTAELTIEDTEIPEITVVPYTYPGTIESDDFTPVTVDIPKSVTVVCEETTVTSFTVKDETSLTPSLSLTTAEGNTYSDKQSLAEYWGITGDEYDTYLTQLAGGAVISNGTWSFQNGTGFFDRLDTGDLLTMTFTFTVNHFTHNGRTYDTSEPGTLSLMVLGTGQQHEDPVGPSEHTASFSVATGEVLYNGSSASLNVLDGVIDPLGYEMTASLVSITPADPSYTVTEGAVAIAADGTVSILAEQLAEDFVGLKYGETTVVTISYRITDTHSGKLDGTITMTVTGRNHAPVETVSHTAAFNSSTGIIIYDSAYTSLNLLDTMYDYDGDAMTASLTAVTPPEGYTISEGAVAIASDGALTVNTTLLQSDFAALPAGKSVDFTISYAAEDIHGAIGTGSLAVTVTSNSEGPQGVVSHTGIVDLRSESVTYDSGKSSLNLLDGVTGKEPLSVSITKIDAGKYDLPSTAVTQTNGQVSVNIADFKEAFKTLAADQTADIIVTFTVSDQTGAAVASAITITVIGVNDAPVETSSLTGLFDIKTGIIEFNSGEACPDILFGVTDPEGNAMIAQILTITPPTGYNVTEGAILLIEDEGVQRILVDTELLSGDFAKLPSGETADIDMQVLIVDANGATLVRTVTLTVAGSYIPTAEEKVNISLVAVTAPTTATELDAGNDFGTFYYLNADDLPVTDYETIASANDYYLELWVQDTYFLVSGDNQKFTQSIQVQLNYENSDDLTVKLEDIYAGNTTIDQYLYYEPSEGAPYQENVKAMQVLWLFDSSADWDLLQPITNGENAYLLARLKVTRTDTSAGLTTTISGVTDSESPFVDGWFYTRTNDSAEVDNSKIFTVDVHF